MREVGIGSARASLGASTAVLERAEASPSARPIAGGRPGPSRNGTAAELLTPDAAATLVPEWRALAGRALEPNILFEPDFALAAMRRLKGCRGGRVAAVWSGGGEARRLVGALPVLPWPGLPGVPVLF